VQASPDEQRAAARLMLESDPGSALGQDLPAMQPARFGDAEDPLVRALAEGELATAAGQHEHAVERAIVLDGDADPSGYLNTKAAIPDDLGRTAEAIPILRILSERNASAASLGNLALTLNRAHLMHEAREVYERLLQLEPDNVEALVSLAHLHSGSQRPECEQCVDYFERHPELFDPTLVGKYALAYLEVDQGGFRYARAVACYARRAGRFRTLLRRIEVLLEQDFDAGALGCLVPARHDLLGDR